MTSALVRPTWRPGCEPRSSGGGDPCPATTSCPCRRRAPACRRTSWTPSCPPARSSSPSPSSCRPSVAPTHRVAPRHVARVRRQRDGTAMHAGDVEGVHALHFDVQILVGGLVDRSIHPALHFHQSAHVGCNLDVAAVDAALAKLGLHAAIHCLGHDSLPSAGTSVTHNGPGGGVGSRVNPYPARTISLAEAAAVAPAVAGRVAGGLAGVVLVEADPVGA